tara:strand:+ start:300 stop:521 length:222 start_codon:yes stop_codon:yes gene_type:complete
MDDDESYFDIPTETVEKTWCKIDERGELSYVDWEMVAKLAKGFNETEPSLRTPQHLQGKLMYLVRKKFDKDFV